MIFRSISILFVLMFTTFCISSCKEGVERDLSETLGKVNMVTLDLTVSVDELAEPSSQTRAFTYDDPANPFEPAVTTYEKLSKLRVIICRPNGVIEHNRLVTLPEAQNTVTSDELKFKVIPGELKTIYLVGNEDYIVKSLLSEYNNKNYFEINFVEGEIFSKTSFNNVCLAMPGNAPVIDNSPEALNPQYIPMSECFDVLVKYPTTDEDFLQNANLFITRSLIKFSFSINVETAFPRGIMLDGIKIDGLGNRSFFLPQDTWYNPPKYTASDYKYAGRFIEQFRVPAEIERKNCIFRSLTPIDMAVVGETQLAPKLYLPETKNGKYSVRLLFTGDDELTEMLGTQDLELTDIPRNTHVKVNITFRDYNISATVDLVPYTGVILKPSFGF